ncbi:ketoacyl-ACP synthase III [Anaplasmataceae bacterium AB001_6]|nr:ketoacyl-ACP synthase III [Anaplasmataceae bacterium AB001_6]
MKNSIPLAVSSFLPTRTLKNDYFAKDLRLDTSDEWIKQRTGIHKRHVVSSETTDEMCVRVAQDVVKKANISAQSLECIIVATSTSSMAFPGCSQIVHKALGCQNSTISFDIQVACSGFVYALYIANCIMKTNNINRALIIGADTMSKIVDYSDRSSCILFGDGAGAVILESCSSSLGMIDFMMGTDSNLTDKLYTTGGIFDDNKPIHIKMDGGAIYVNAIKRMEQSITSILKKNDISIDQIKYFIPHQANIRIIESLAKSMSIDISKFVINVDKHANTSAASIPLSLDTVFDNITSGDIVVLSAVGAGFNWGSVLIKF